MKMQSCVTSRAAALALGALLFGVVPTQAQEKKLGLYAGYAFYNTDDGNLHGVRLSPEYRLNGFASVVGDFSMEKGTLSDASTTLTTYLGGFRVKKGIGSASLFAHALAGGARTSASIKPFASVSISVAETGLGLDGGGGLEFKLSKLKLRIGADYFRRSVDVGGKTVSEGDVRATVGVVF